MPSHPNSADGGGGGGSKDAAVARTAGILAFSGIALSILKALTPKPPPQFQPQSLQKPSSSAPSTPPLPKKPIVEDQSEHGSTSVSARTVEIVKGDTLWGLSRKYGVTIDAIKEANGITGDKIYAGKKLVIP